MEIDELIQAHIVWKLGLRAACMQSEPIDVLDLARADSAPLGRWLRGDGWQKWSHLPEFQAVVEVNRVLHLHAAELGELANAGMQGEACRGMAPGSTFAEVADELVKAVHALRTQVRQLMEEESRETARLLRGRTESAPVQKVLAGAAAVPDLTLSAAGVDTALVPMPLTRS